VFADPRKFFSITDAGLAALGPEAPQKPAPWVKVEAVSAARARDVAERQGRHSVDDRTSWARSQQGSRARLKALATTLANKTEPFILSSMSLRLYAWLAELPRDRRASPPQRQGKQPISTQMSARYLLHAAGGSVRHRRMLNRPPVVRDFLIVQMPDPRYVGRVPLTLRPRDRLSLGLERGDLGRLIGLFGPTSQTAEVRAFGDRFHEFDPPCALIGLISDP
jgi:hypothetical protein